MADKDLKKAAEKLSGPVVNGQGEANTGTQHSSKGTGRGSTAKSNGSKGSKSAGGSTGGNKGGHSN